MKKGTKKNSAKKEEKKVLLKELKKLKEDLTAENKIADEIKEKIKNIDATVFLGYHDIKVLKLEEKKKEIELEENKSQKILSSRKVENVINKFVLKCYEAFLENLAKNEMELHGYTQISEEDKKKQQENRDYEKLTTVTSIQHLNKLNSIVLSQNEMIAEINRRFTRSLKKAKENCSRKINIEREKLDKKRQKVIFKLQSEKNEAIKNILAGYSEKILNMQSYFKLILDDQLWIIQKLENEKLNKRKIFLSKKKHLEELKKDIVIHTKKLEQLDKDVGILEKNIVDYEKLKTDLKRIKEKRKKQQKILTELKLESDIKKMLLAKISREYEAAYARSRMKLYDHLQRVLLENYFLETKIKLKSEALEISNIELSKWKESVDPKQNEILNRTLRKKFCKFEKLRKEVDDLIDANERNKENYEAIMHLNYFSNEDLDVLKRESVF
ncbi:conserved Plasmodium protein, unknown function [Plasmodium knowlesi strain H]|uniref:Growth arrest-specific protein 8 domain-containing protein n=3 Tax=Plasmodium knowlesi TaxID=5850 RepID=A0A5K1VJX6_PLAKH|nr:GAS8-like protein, putative [Plasmodium knowlesi strain H]OTN64765.1 Uncharacterized protein PKNOH_S130191800 [Plasmodium knowlesi]CAA9989081.1 GAS8-like protein, putative [Plasmodium knowlesi strain H]SBO27294.1 conserved Plasmodium protein, unknown function [Plasmodium knowlesi strain H]SBO28921.1 conserved Plasmodium protein, unknown function [Plasmodium knowlesi strain H]VVS78555.1 GAS8-like protein, putative [Plasmodium knowlesi strain H]|eukprot:XP_002261429.1 hypothetical protein, conserved in Plasmodium species [Plasmodium knowlesi strain H]